MKLYYIKPNCGKEYIIDGETINCFIEEIKTFWTQFNYTIPYIRLSHNKDEQSLWLDYGSHTNFYVIYYEDEDKDEVDKYLEGDKNEDEQ